jgi:hypothetical protein
LRRKIKIKIINSTHIDNVLSSDEFPAAKTFGPFQDNLGTLEGVGLTESSLQVGTGDFAGSNLGQNDSIAFSILE